MSSTETQTKIDYLTEDTPISGQEWGVYSFLSPDGIKGCTVRAFKNRGNFATQKEASEYAEKLRNNEPTFHVFVGENFKWTIFDPDPNLIKDNNYYENKLQELMKGNLENQEKIKQLESQRKREMIENAIKDELKKKAEMGGKESTRDKLRRKLEKRKKTASSEDQQVTNELAKHENEVENEADDSTEDNTNTNVETEVKENIATIDENLDKMKKLYAELLKKKQESQNSTAN